ncbi:hypothetical protein ABKV19_011879 [Rosa sericea]
MFSTERHCFVSRAIQRELPSDVVLPDTEIQRGEEIILMVPIRLRFFKLIGRGSHRWIGAPRDVTYDGEPILINEVGINFNLSLIKSTRHQFREYMARKLTSLGVPKYEQPAIHHKIAQAVQVALPHLPISVIMVDVTVHLFGEAVTPITGIMADLLGSVSRSQVTIDTDTWESMETYIHEPTSIPATKTSIESLENLRLDDLEEDTIRQASPCVICLEQLDHFDADLLMVVTRLPCSHLYHRACIIGWLEKSHLCPLCQYPMPSVEAEARKKPTKPSWTQHWPMLLMMSAGGVITATLVCRLWKRSEG